MKVLLRSPNWIGDCVMSVPAIRALKARMPEISLTLVTRPHLTAVYKNISEIDEIITIPSGRTFPGFIDAVRTIRRSGIISGILFTNSFNSALMMRLAGVKRLTGYRKDLRGSLLSRSAPFPSEPRHQMKRYSDLSGLFLGIEDIGSFSNMLIIDAGESDRAEEILRRTGMKEDQKLIGISPAAAYGTSKEWPVESHIELIRKISGSEVSARFALFGSSSDERKIKQITDSVKENILSVTGDYSLREAISLISKCSLFIGNDSGLLHIADALGVPSIGIFGPTSPLITAPQGKNTFIFYKNADCSPCSHRICPIDHRCMETITSDEVAERSLLFLK